MPNHKYPSSSYARILFRHLRLCEQSCGAFLAGTPLSYKELMTLDGNISGDDLRQIYRNALLISKRDDLGLSVGTQLHLSAHGPLGVATTSGPDLRTGLMLLAKYSQTRTDFFDITVSQHQSGMSVYFAETVDLGDLRVFITESVLIGLFSAINFFLGPGQFKGQVSFAYPKPSYAHNYPDYFGHCINFNQPSTEIIVPESSLSISSPTADPDMHQQSLAILERDLNAIKGEASASLGLSTKDAVAKMIGDNPGRMWTLDEVASSLHMSSRTAIRKLAAEGTQFQIIRDELYKKQAINYLSDASLSVESIGYLIGFSDVASFRRSFKRWFGETPSAYRRRVYRSKQI